MLVKLISTIWEQRQKYLSFCFNDFFITFVHCSFLFMCTFISTIQSILWKWNNICLIMQCRHFNHTWIFMTLLCLLCGVKCHIRQHLYCYKGKRDWMGHNRTHVRIWLWIIFIASDTDTVTQITLLTQAAHGGLTELLLHAVHGFMGVQWVTTDSNIPYYWRLYPA
jgi:hypothetical protein